MSLNVLNKRFLSLLCNIGVDIDAFPDKTFDGLFERRQNDLNYFLEWFVDNITQENALTEAEVDVYQYLKACNLCLTDEELNFAVSKCSPSYEDLQFLNENYVDSLAVELEEFNVEYKQLLSINSDLEGKYVELKKKPNHLKEECNRTKRKLEEVKDELQVLNSHFSSVNEDINNFNLNNFNDVLDISKFKSACEEEEKLTERFSAINFQCNETVPFLNEELSEITKLKLNLATAKYCSIVSKSFLEEVKYKILKADEFLNKLKDESDNHFTFEEVLSNWFDLYELNMYDKLVEEVNCLQLKELTENLDKECELIWHHFLSQSYSHKLCANNAKLSKYHDFTKHIKLDIVNNLLLKQVINKSKEKEMEFSDVMNEFYCSMSKNQNNIRNAIESITCRNKISQDYYRNLNEKHALLLSSKRMNQGNLQEKFSCNNTCDAVKLLFDSPFFYPVELFDKFENTTATLLSKILCGPTNEVQMAPIELTWEFSKCEQLLAEKSHSIQRLLTEYVNTKEAISSTNRRQLLLWIDFLINPDSLVAGLEELQMKSLNCSSKISDLTKC